MSYNYVITTVSTKEEAELIAKNLVTNHLAACVNIVPSVTSVYKWNNDVCCDNELILMIKTKKDLFEKVKNEILKNHSYELPAIVSVPIENGHIPFLQWVKDQCKE